MDDLEAVIVKGSAVRGDFIAGYSDLDVHIYLRSKALYSPRTPLPEQAVSFQRGIGGLKPEEYGVSFFQVNFLDASDTDFLPPSGGPATFIYRKRDFGFGEIPESAYVEDAREALEDIPQNVATVLTRFVDKPDTEIWRPVRLAGAYLKAATYNLLCLLEKDFHGPWNLPFREAAARLLKFTQGEVDVNRFLDYVENWELVRTNAEKLRQSLLVGVGCLQAIFDCSKG